jgi:hypothetical protein
MMFLLAHTDHRVNVLKKKHILSGLPMTLPTGELISLMRDRIQLPLVRCIFKTQFPEPKTCLA